MRADHRTLIDRGRRAGLQTGELYQAMSSLRQVETSRTRGLADGNGFIVEYDVQGRLIYQPAGGNSRA